MKAVVCDRYGPPDVLRIEEVAQPVPAAGEVLIRIRGGSEAFLAWSEKPLPKGATVLVIESRGARVVDVIEWEDVLGDSPRIPGLRFF